MINRRDWLTAAALAALPSVNYAKHGRKRLLVFTRSAEFQHEVVTIKDGTCLVHEVMSGLARRHDFDVECTKDGRVFDSDIGRFDAFFFFTTGDLTSVKCADGSPPMTASGKKAFLDAVAAGKGFVGSHCASDTFRRGETRATQPPAERDPYIAMLGGEFLGHNDEQPATMRVVDPAFPGLPGANDFSITEEWYSIKNFAPDLHVILVQETQGMKGVDYARPKYPATWARMQGRGRVFYTSMGHRPDVWKNPVFQNLLLGAFRWTTGQVQADVPANLAHVTPAAATLPPAPPPKPAETKKG